MCVLQVAFVLVALLQRGALSSEARQALAAATRSCKQAAVAAEAVGAGAGATWHPAGVLPLAHGGGSPQVVATADPVQPGFSTAATVKAAAQGSEGSCDGLQGREANFFFQQVRSRPYL